MSYCNFIAMASFTWKIIQLQFFDQKNMLLYLMIVYSVCIKVEILPLRKAQRVSKNLLQTPGELILQWGCGERKEKTDPGVVPA